MKNLNELAREITLLEGKKQSVSIAQVKEIIKCLCILIKKHPIEIVGMLLRSARTK